jgi:hypothetical protein
MSGGAILRRQKVTTMAQKISLICCLLIALATVLMIVGLVGPLKDWFNSTGFVVGCVIAIGVFTAVLMAVLPNYEGR